MVLPILKDFKPEIIVNSAGQDNHYTDPITNMNFSAQGYAMLNEKLNPDIAVLEGGYSIQGALPYVNLGIILAMAGVDYSHVREPDYRRGRAAARTRASSDYIKKLKNVVLDAYHKPPRVRGTCRPTGEFMTRKKNIFYDTDGIRETQIESIMRCKECSGLFSLETYSTVCSLSLGIEIPIGACRSCEKEGVKLLNSAKKSGKYSTIQVIDRVKKEYYRV